MAPVVRMFAVSLAVMLAAGACSRLSGEPPSSLLSPADAMQSIRLIQTYDTDHDGVISKTEVEAGLQREFAACDANHDGKLSSSETQAENDRRWKESGPASSPLIDWSQDGFIDFAEFSNTARSVFSEMDRDQDGSLSVNEMRQPRIRPQEQMPMPGRQGRRRG